MKHALAVLFVSFFVAGLIILPQGDFRILGSLEAMYVHCKSTEDKDLTPLDFITDHLLDLDCIFDQHDHGDEQKPHTPIPASHFQNTTWYLAQAYTLLPQKPFTASCQLFPAPKTECLQEFLTGVFRPPSIYLSF